MTRSLLDELLGTDCMLTENYPLYKVRGATL